jgi:hypothetical protein
MKISKFDLVVGEDVLILGQVDVRFLLKINILPSGPG